MTGWRAGAAALPFPIDPGTPMSGYAARSGPSTGTLDQLEVAALALGIAGQELLIVSADVVSVDEALTQQVARKAGIARDALLLAASHTHSAPAGISARLHVSSSESLDHQLRRRFVETCVEAITVARARLVASQLSFGSAPATGLASNRNDPGGPFDPMLSALAVRDDTRAIAAAVVHWACHPTTLGAENRLISADFPGALRSELRRALEVPELPVLFLNGAAGDVSTRFTRKSQGPDEVERIGVSLTAVAVDSMMGADLVLPEIRHRSTTVQLTGWSSSGVSHALSNAEADGTDAGLLGDGQARKAVTRAQGLQMLRALATSDCRPRRRFARIDAWRVGDLRLVGVPGELLASLGNGIVAATPGPALVVGYCGGYEGYFADRAAYQAGTYEALASPWAPGTGERVAEAIKTMVRVLR